MTMLRRRNIHGVSIGILMLETGFRRFPGDVGNARTWPFPVHYKVVKGASPDRVTGKPGEPAPGEGCDATLLEAFKAAASDLVAEGVDAITTSCGFLALHQRELADHCPVPVATSALLQVPMAARLLARGRRPAIMTFSAEGLTRRHLEAVGVDPATPVFGMPSGSEFQRSIRAGDPGVERGRLLAEVLDVARTAVSADPSIGALVLECTNLSPYSADLNRALGLPILDIVSLVHWLHRSLDPEVFDQGDARP